MELVLQYIIGNHKTISSPFQVYLNQHKSEIKNDLNHMNDMNLNLFDLLQNI